MHVLIRAALAALLALSTVLGLSTLAAADPLPCDSGELCLWSEASFVGAPAVMSLSDTTQEECVPLPEGMDARSFINQLSKPVTVYQSTECATEGEFDTYPGRGTYVPASPFVVRAVQIWFT
ncbi:Peptidase inhibitor family I36 [Actinokineospora alba]|uniref:Peptidase inhibitor family I36 n=1 Tax=Actinokineospora alba TaxID=504798 RepID=A0A1H0RKI5_9PSEU|nr:peptidase inhibitor family I36 protein [Actinokineospora alba]TDP67038.1 peptidase inhibitor family I36 [Actinokineospora alba]SDJ31057.1 Peptidase inhibitor family I36 [Actinokineospora alba]SDP29981.1 Peptidase inhibitor family I36 [Actinokineospora alba]